MAEDSNEHMLEIRQRVFDLYIELFDRGREPTLKDISRVVYILRLAQRGGCFGDAKASGILGGMAQALGVTPGMLWLGLILCGILIGKPFFDFLQTVLPFIG